MIDKIHYKNHISYALPTIKNDRKIGKSEMQEENSSYQIGMQVWEKTTYDEPSLEIEEKKWDKVEELITMAQEELTTLYARGYIVEDHQAYDLKQNDKKEYTYTETTKTKIERVKQNEDSMYLYAMTTGNELTLNSLYKASFMGNNKKSSKNYSSAEITSVLHMNQIDSTQGNRRSVTKLLELGLDINKEQVIKYQNIQEIVERFQYEEVSDRDEVNAANLQTNEWMDNPKEAYEERILMKEEKILYIDKEISQIVDELSRVDNQTIGQVIESGDEVTIGNLRASLFKNTQKVLGIEQESASKLPQLEGEEVVVGTNEGSIPQVKTQEIEQVKEQIKEIRARLNVESAYRLSERMPLESSELIKVAEELRKIEEQTIEEVMHTVKLEPTPNHKGQLKHLLQATQAIASYPEQTVGVQLATHEQATVEEIHEAIKVYEETGTVAEKRFGETLSKVEAQIQRFLNQHQLPQDTKTVQCAKALIANQIDLSLDNLEGVRPLVDKMNIILEEMTPYRAASFIKEGLNPYKASINHLVEWIGKERMPEMKESIVSAIVTLEDKGKINEAQKQSLVGLYRILHGTQINHEQVVGYLFKNELPLTIEHLEEAVKYSDKGNMIEKRIDDSFGEIERIKYTQETAKQMIENVKGDIKKLVDLSKILENESIPVTNDKLDKLTKLNSMIYPFVKQTLKRELGKYEGIDLLPQSLQDKISRIKDMEPEVIKMMVKQDVPITIANLATVDEMIKNPSKYKELLEENDMIQDHFPESFEELEKAVEKLKEDVIESKEEAAQQGDFIGYKNYRQLEEMVEVQKQLTQKSGIYHIPFIVDGEMRHIDLYVNEHSKKKVSKIGDNGLNVVMSYQTKSLGQLMAYINIKDEQINYKVTAEKKQATGVLEKEKEILEEILVHMGYGVQHSEYASSQSVSMMKVAQKPISINEGNFEVEV